MSLLLLFYISPEGGVTPTVTTDSPVVSIGRNTAYAGGNVTDDGGQAIIDRGIVVGTSINPTTSGTKFAVSGTTGEFTVQLTGLLPNTLYYVRAYAVNANGTAYGDNVTFTTKVFTVQKHFYYKVYKAGVYQTTWTKEVISEPEIRTTINGGAGSMTIKLARKFDDFGEDEDVTLNNTIKAYVVDKESPNGQLFYHGYISGYKPVVRESKESVEITVFGFVAELNRFIFKDGANTTVTYNSYDPSNILKDVITKYRALGGSLNYSNDSITLTNTVVSYTFNTNTVREVFDKIIELCPDGWYFRIDPDGLVYLRPRSDTADHTFTLGKDVENLETFRRVDDVVNAVYFTGGGSPPMFRLYENTGSRSSFGRYDIKKVDQRVTNTDTASTLSNRNTQCP